MRGAVPPPPDVENDPTHVRIHLANGTVLDVHVEEWGETGREPDEIAQVMKELLPDRPGWLRLDSTVIYTGAVSAFEVLG